MLDIVLYNCSSDKRRVSKDLPNDKIVATYSDATLKENTSVVNPTFKLSYNQFTLGIPNGFNYLYCPYLKRYYFINDVRYCKAGIVEIECHVDVLKTYEDAIRGHNAYIERCEKKFFTQKKLLASGNNGIFYDSEYPIRTDVEVVTIPIGQVANGHAFFLTVNGGVSV